MPTLQEYQQFFEEKEIIQSISEVKPLQQFIEQYPDQTLIARLIELEKNYKYYRAICGDGNCFYRAIMFQYLRSASLQHYERLFPEANLLSCDHLPFRIPRGFDSESILRYIWERYLLPLNDRRPEDREKQLEDMLNNSKNLDASLIAYLRVLNFNYLSRHRDEYEQFSDGSLNNDLRRIKTFGQESEGVELYTLATVLEAEVTVLMVHPESYVQFNINSDPRFLLNFIVSFRPGHYDIPISMSEASRLERKHFRPSFGTPREPGSSFGSSAISKMLNRKDQQTERKTFPQVVIIKSPSEVRRITVKNPESGQSQSGSQRTAEKRPPESMKSFSANRLSSSTVYQHESVTKEEEKPEAKQAITGSKPRLPRTSLHQQKQQERQKRVMCQSLFCVFGVFSLMLALFIL